MLKKIACRTYDRYYRPFLGDEVVDELIGGESDRDFDKTLDGFYVLCVGVSVVAFAQCVGKMLAQLMVDVSRHREGVGSFLLSRCEDIIFKSSGLAELQTSEKNHKAVQLYLKSGWEIDKEKSERFGNGKLFLRKLRPNCRCCQ